MAAEDPPRPQKLAILVWAADPDSPHLCASPFYFAAAAAAMDAEVEMYFTARAVRLLEIGVAERLYASPIATETQNIGRFLADAHDFGVRFYACPNALRACALSPNALRPEVSGLAGAATFLGRSLDPDWRTLTF